MHKQGRQENEHTWEAHTWLSGQHIQAGECSEMEMLTGANALILTHSFVFFSVSFFLAHTLKDFTLSLSGYSDTYMHMRSIQESEPSHLLPLASLAQEKGGISKMPSNMQGLQERKPQFIPALLHGQHVLLPPTSPYAEVHAWMPSQYEGTGPLTQLLLKLNLMLLLQLNS